MLSQLFPDQVFWKIAEPWMWETSVCPEEENLISKAVDKRKREFRAGRNCAHALFKEHNIQCNALLKGNQREPAWPNNWVGSISHTQGLCVVAIASKQHFQSIGLDVEQATPLSDDIRDLICSPQEQDSLSRLQLVSGNKFAGKSLDKLIFSAKESIHKTYYPINYHTLDFLDAKITLSGHDESFSAEILKPEATPNQVIKHLDGKYCFFEQYVASFIGLAAK